MKEKVKSICMVIGFLLILIGFGLAFIIVPDKAISVSERRKLTEFPEVSLKTVQNGEWFDDFDKYMLDQFPLRDELRTVKAISEYGVFAKADNNGIYISDGYVCKVDYPLDTDAVVEGCEKMNQLYQAVFNEAEAYYSIIPDKNYFLAESSGHLCVDYNELFSVVDESIDSRIKYINITPCLDIEKYYKTDLHWKQQTIVPVADRILTEMELPIPSRSYSQATLTPFYGAYFGQAALPVSPDEITYLSNDTLERCTVYNPLKNTYSSVYEIESFGGIDSYNLFLSGAESLLIIDNPTNPDGDELYIIRDSFSSALAPLLIESCSKIVLIDPRYIGTENIVKYISPGENVKALFIFSTSILNKGYLFR